MNENAHSNNKPVGGSILTIPVAVEPQTDNQIRLLSDTTDALGVRHVMIQTTATGNNSDGYKDAELQAHSWFFAIYDPINPRLTVEAITKSALETTQLGLAAGRISGDWLKCPHPIIRNSNGKFMFGHHRGVNPNDAEPTWGFQFEVIEVK
jgi:hypothetical protein